jgi:hypothetical protein
MKAIHLLLLTPLLIGGWGFPLKAQEPPGCEKRIYVAPDGKIFVQRYLPLYVRISTSPAEGAKSYLLTSEATPKYSNPLYLDAEGKHTFRTPWAVDTSTKQMVYPAQDIVFEVYADGLAPVTSLKFNKGKTLPRNNKIFVNGKVAITLNAIDWMSGVEKVMVSLDGNPYEPYGDGITLKEEKEYALRYYAVDHTGNMEAVHKVIIVIDKSAPKANFKLAGNTNNNVLSGSSTIGLTADEDAAGIAGIYYSIDSGSFKPYEFALQTRYLPQGDHNVRYYVEDHLGNTSDTGSYAFYIDKTPPVIVQDFIGKSFIANGKEYASGKTLVKLTSFDNKSGVKAVYYSVNDGEYQQYEKAFYPPDQNGDMRIYFYAVDNVGNRSETQGGQTSASAIPYVDLTGPLLKYDFLGPVYRMSDTLFVSNRTKIRLRAFDEESGMNRIEFRVDTSSYSIYSEPFIVNSEGRHSIHFVGYDQVDNTNQESFVAEFDTTGPAISIAYSTVSRGQTVVNNENVDIFPVNTSLFVSATDAKAGFDRFFYSLDETAEVPCTGMISRISKLGFHTIRIRSLDRLGNLGSREFHFIISDLK